MSRPSAPYFDSVTSESSYTKRIGASRPPLARLQGKGTSNWGLPQLLSCRVVVTANTDATILPILAHHATEDFARRLKIPPRQDDNKSSPEPDDTSENEHQKRGLAELRKLCNGPQPLHSRHPTEHKRVWTDDDGSLARLWAALDRVRPHNDRQRADTGAAVDFAHGAAAIADEGHDAGEDSGPRPQTPPNRRWLKRRHSSTPIVHRTRTATGSLKPAPVKSHETQIESSSPTEPPSSQHSAYIPDQGPTATRRDWPETLTLRFASSFIRSALPWLPPQDNPEADPVVLFDDVEASPTVRDLGDISFTSRDDGGIVTYYDEEYEGRVAIFEAKRDFDTLVEGKPAMSDSRFGQLVGEALAARLEGGLWKGSPETAIMITAARCYMRLLQVDISDAYVSQLRAHASDYAEPFTEYMYVSATRWFDLTDAGDRRAVVRNLAGLVQLVHSNFAR